MNEELWNSMSPDEQTSWLWREFSRRLLAAVIPPPFDAGNDHTEIVTGMNTLIAQKGASS